MLIKKPSLTVIYFFLSALSGIAILFPYMNFQFLFATGDHGRDLYGFYRTLLGDAPYRDYWWVYGPLMPYYYASVFALLGVTAKSIILGKLFLQWVCGLVFFLSVNLWLSSAMAFLATLWFWVYQPDFFFTYNHIGGVLALTGIIGIVLAYIKKPDTRLICLGFVLCVILALVKLNIGLSTLLAMALSLGANDKIHQRLSKERKIFYFKCLLAAAAAIGTIYFLFLRGLPWHYLRQCFPYLEADHQYTSSIGHALTIYLNTLFAHIGESLPNLLFAAIIIFSGLKISIAIFQKQSAMQLKKDTLSISLAFVFFTILNLHEFLNSGVFYRTFWVDTFKIFFMFFLIDAGIRNFSFVPRLLLMIALLSVITIDTSNRNQMIRSYKTPAHYLPYDNAKIFIGNSPEWIDTVRKTTDYLTSTLSPHETFLAAPYDPIYYYLTKRQSPSRYLIFFDHINVHPSQEKELITLLENKNVNYVVLSSRMSAREIGLGTFGETYCPLLADYITKNFKVATVFGDWQNDPGWAWNHGTKILRRIQVRSASQ